MTHHQMRMLLLRATSLILRAIHLAAEAILMMASGVLKQKLIELMLMRTIGALIKNVPTIIKRSNDPYLNELKPSKVLVQQQ